MKFFIKAGKNKNINQNKSNNRLKLSISQENDCCINCLKINFLSENKKNDLKTFLNRYYLERNNLFFLKDKDELIELILNKVYHYFFLRI